MFDTLLPSVIGVSAGFQNIVETDQVGLNVHIRMIYGIADACLGSQIYHHIEPVFRKESVHQFPVPDGTLYEYMPDVAVLSGLLHKTQAVFLERGIIIVVQIIQRDNRTGG